MSTPLGQVIVPASGSTATRAKYEGSRSGSNTPRHVRPAKSGSQWMIVGEAQVPGRGSSGGGGRLLRTSTAAIEEGGRPRRAAG